MKKIVITGYTQFGDQPEKKNIVATGEESMDANDGYHTFTELYDHRITLFIALARALRTHKVWRSELHSDGTSFDGWFVLGINDKPGKQITYHLPNSRWEETDFAFTVDRAPEFDGHTAEDVLERLKTI